MSFVSAAAPQSSAAANRSFFCSIALLPFSPFCKKKRIHLSLETVPSPAKKRIKNERLFFVYMYKTFLGPLGESLSDCLFFLRETDHLQKWIGHFGFFGSVTALDPYLFGCHILMV